jgi:hypothetical protein
MRNQATATPPQPVTVEVVPRPGGGVQISTPQATRPITQAEISVIRQQRSEMSNQLNSAQNRREELLDEMRSAPPGTEQGLQQQFLVLNDRIVAIEKDIEASGRTLRQGQVPVGTIIVPPRGFNDLPPEAAAERGAALAASVLIPTFVVFLVLRGRRRRRRGRTEERYSSEQDARMERLEQAVDAIAIEVERVGEAQRYQTKLLAEANLMPAMGIAQKAGEPARVRDFDR